MEINTCDGRSHPRSFSITFFLKFSVVSVCAVIYGRYMKTVGEDLQKALADANAIAEEAFANVRTG